MKKDKAIPLHQSLTEVILMGGIPRQMAIMTWTVVLAVGVGLRSWYALPLGLLLHLIFSVLTRYDPQFMDTFIRHFRYKRQLIP